MLTKSITSKLHLNQRLYFHRMTKGTYLKNNLSVFEKIAIDLETLEVMCHEEDLGLTLLCSLPTS